MITSSGDHKMLAGLFDDAAIFPPGNLVLNDALPAYFAHRNATYRDLVGLFVVGANDLSRVADLMSVYLEHGGTQTLHVAVTGGVQAVAVAIAEARVRPAVRVDALEVVLPDAATPADTIPMVRDALRGLGEFKVFVEVPRDVRARRVIEELAGSGIEAKFRTGGVHADLYPSETELGANLRSAVLAGVPFKVTAGLHHALRNTDPATGFEQHGFVNVLAATAAAQGGASESDIVGLLSDRTGDQVVEVATAGGAEARRAFRSLGTCSIVEPVSELAQLGIIDDETSKNVR